MTHKDDDELMMMMMMLKIMMMTEVCCWYLSNAFNCIAFKNVIIIIVITNNLLMFRYICNIKIVHKVQNCNNIGKISNFVNIAS